MPKFLHADDKIDNETKAKAIPRVFSETAELKQ